MVTVWKNKITEEILNKQFLDSHTVLISVQMLISMTSASPSLLPAWNSGSLSGDRPARLKASAIWNESFAEVLNTKFSKLGSWNQAGIQHSDMNVKVCAHLSNHGTESGIPCKEKQMTLLKMWIQIWELEEQFKLSISVLEQTLPLCKHSSLVPHTGGLFRPL